MQITEKILENHLRSLLIDMPGSSMGCVQLWFKAGSALEGENEWGIAHFLEHMFFKGKVQNQKDLIHSAATTIVKQVESFGGEMNAFTSFDYTCYYINTPNNFLPQAIDLLMKMICFPDFNQQELIPEKEVVYEEYLRSIDHPGQYAFSQLQKLCFLHNYSHPILGAEKSIKNFNEQLLYNFRNNHYSYNNAFLIIGGSLKDRMEEIISIVEKYQLPEGEDAQFLQFKLKQQSSIDIHQKDVNIAQLNMAVESLPYLNPLVGAEDLALNCLGYGETSRLYRRLVHESGLANNCYTSSMYLNDGGVHFIKISAPPENLYKIYPLFIEVIDETLRQKAFDPKIEIEKIKNQYIASKIYEKESLESYAFALGNSYVQTGDIYGEHQFIEKLKQSGAQEVQRGFQEVMNRPLHAVLQIPQKCNLELFRSKLEKFHSKLQQTIHRANPKGQSKNNIKRNAISSSNAQSNVLLRMPSKFDSAAAVFTIWENKSSPKIKLIYRQNKLTPTFVLHFYLKGGLAYEDKKTNGYHHLISEVISKGHSNISYQKLQRILEERSASLGGICGKNAYGLTMHGQSKDFEELSKHFIGSILNANFSKREVMYERKMTYRSINIQKKDPAKQCFKQVNSTLFEKHPYALEIEGTRESLKNVTNEKLIKIHQQNLRNADELIFTYCGDLELSRVQDQLLSLLNPLALSGQKRRPAAKNRTNSAMPEIPAMPKVYGKNIFIPFDREQTQIFIGLPTFEMTNKNEIFIKILSTYFSGQSSELFVRVRDQLGLCYTVSPLHFSGLNGGYFGIYMAASCEKSEQAINELRQILDRVRANGLSNDDFQRSKRIIEGQMQLSIQTNDDYANIYSIPELHDLGIDFTYNTNQRIQGCTLESFNSFIKNFLSHEWNLFQVGKEREQNVPV
ncbi:MAG: insulinase family protein [Oligoflexia bacterium]|nr:insulinase family protein [Oligoflexia bacterium]